jgi:hypothetical protein
MSITRPTSRTTAFAFIVPKVMIWATLSRPVLARDVLDHLAAARFAEVDVDVGGADALLVQEALEDQLVLDRIDVGDAQAVGDEAAGGRSAAGADRDLPLARVADEVPDDQEVAREADAVDDRDLLVEPRLVVRERVAQAAALGERVEGLAAARRSRRASPSRSSCRS